MASIKKELEQPFFGCEWTVLKSPHGVNMAEPNSHGVNSLYAPLRRESAKLGGMNNLDTFGRIVALKNTKINQL